jgi:hypothetical protein
MDKDIMAKVLAMDMGEAMSILLATVAIIGFAIQQVLEILKPFVALCVKKYVSWRDVSTTKVVMSEAEIMKATMAMLAFILGAIIVGLTKVSLLVFVNPAWGGTFGDIIVSALVLGAGTDGLNTLTKYIGYVKESRKAGIPKSVEISIVPPETPVKVDQTIKFRAFVKNSENKSVQWEVTQGTGGSISTNGEYTAPSTPGEYQVIAISKADQEKYAVATVTVTA